MRLFLTAALLALAALPAMAGVITPPSVPVPEPATLAVLGAGVAGLLLARRRRK